MGAILALGNAKWYWNNYSNKRKQIISEWYPNVYLSQGSLCGGVVVNVLGYPSEDFFIAWASYGLSPC